MGRIATRIALAGAGVLALRALAPKLHARVLAACEHVFDEAPDTFPPKRMLRGIEEIRANSARTLVLLEEREHASEPEPVSEGSHLVNAANARDSLRGGAYASNQDD